MTARTSPETRAELARLLDAATPGPWTWAAAVNALPDILADLADAEAEVESLTAERDELRAGAQADAWLGESVARLLTAETARGRSERDALAAKVERVADEVARIADDSQHEGWDSPRVRSIVGRIQRALDGGPTDER